MRLDRWSNGPRHKRRLSGRLPREHGRDPCRAKVLFLAIPYRAIPHAKTIAADGVSCWKDLEIFGGAGRDRTDGLVVANDALSQLSYSPKKEARRRPRWIYCNKALLAIRPSRRRDVGAAMRLPFQIKTRCKK